ncbi:MAG: 2-phosphosulfolactate phosphatase [Chitinophagales bacterium]
MTYNQTEFDIRLEWGIKGVEQLSPISDVIILVDVLSFSSSVDIATSNEAIIYPYAWKDQRAIEYAKSIDADLASLGRKTTHGHSLSPDSLTKISKGTKLVLPSPNGSTLSLSTGKTTTLCGCLRNAKAVAEYASKVGKSIAVIPAGERWRQDWSLRPAFEDLLGAGAIISYLKGRLSPESKTALAVFCSLQKHILEELKNCSSGKELIERGFEADVILASQLNISKCVPILKEGAYRKV